MTLRECNFEQVHGAVVCGLQLEDGVELFPGDHWRLDASVTGLLVHLLSPVRFLSSFCAMSSNTTAAQLQLRLEMANIAAPELPEGSAPQAPLEEPSDYT